MDEYKKRFLYLVHRGKRLIDAYKEVYNAPSYRNQASKIVNSKESQAYLAELKITSPSIVSVLKEIEEVRRMAVDKNDPSTALRCLLAKLDLIDTGNKNTPPPDVDIDKIKKIRQSLLKDPKEIIDKLQKDE